MNSLVWKANMKISQEKTCDQSNSKSLELIWPRILLKQKKIKILITLTAVLLMAIFLLIILLWTFMGEKTRVKYDKKKEFCFNPEFSSLGKVQSNTCPSISAYAPRAMTLKSSIFNNFTIKEQIICNNGQVYLHCSSNHIIKILSAYYGLHTSTVCANHSSNYSLTCFNKDTLEKIKHLCDNKKYCLISASTRYFGDPCPGVDKQMVVQYQCIYDKTNLTKSQCEVDTTLKPVCPNSNSSAINQNIWCEPSNLNIQCPDRKVIQILCGFYGIDANYNCLGTFKSGSEPSYCYSRNSSKKLMSSCTGKQKCFLRGDPNFVLGSNFENVCPGYAKILLVQWNCVDSMEPVLEPLEVRTDQKIDFCKSSYEPKCSKLFNFFPTLLNTNSFFPIYDQVICENSRVVLSCPENLKIFIISAFYGHKTLFGANECSFSESESLQPNRTQCFWPSSLRNVKSLCDNRTNCLLNASMNRSEDVCPGLAKKMLLEYQCMPSEHGENLNQRCMDVIDNANELTFNCGSLNDSFWEIVSNDTWFVNITCDTGEIISVNCGFYVPQTVPLKLSKNICLGQCLRNEFCSFVVFKNNICSLHTEYAFTRFVNNPNLEVVFKKELKINHCNNDPFMNGATCENKLDEYACHCNHGFFGKKSNDTDTCKPCLSGFRTYNNYPFNCYKYHFINKNYESAKLFCQSLNSFLWTPKTLTERNIFVNERAWVYSKINYVGEPFVWPDGSKVYGMDTNEPNNCNASREFLIRHG
ncbi:rhamnose-binding lectin-like [Brachionus plicatilis]|uniref:Rhamnose-binding lectin-like n=1 Tax=Brachionus plicatilis TaxID=10195 RepID=A0A3M7SZR3_BRAPC|nr:rhamnose-binding lectin-like [Brachionus plicatilis]